MKSGISYSLNTRDPDAVSRDIRTASKLRDLCVSLQKAGKGTDAEKEEKKSFKKGFAK